MHALFLFLAILTVAAAIMAVTARQLVHAALSLAGALAGLALIYLGLGAQFVGWVQILVYVGAVAILIVFAILLTRSSETQTVARWGRAAWIGLALVLLVFGGLAVAILSSGDIRSSLLPAPANVSKATVQDIGRSLMTDHVVALEAMGMLLTAALIGGVLIALDEGKRPRGPAVTPRPADQGMDLSAPNSPGGAA